MSDILQGVTQLAQQGLQIWGASQEARRNAEYQRALSSSRDLMGRLYDTIRRNPTQQAQDIYYHGLASEDGTGVVPGIDDIKNDIYETWLTDPFVRQQFDKAWVDMEQNLQEAVRRNTEQREYVALDVEAYNEALDTWQIGDYQGAYQAFQAIKNGALNTSVWDPQRAQQVETEWRRLGINRITQDINLAVDSKDRDGLNHIYDSAIRIGLMSGDERTEASRAEDMHRIYFEEQKEEIARMPLEESMAWIENPSNAEDLSEDERQQIIKIIDDAGSAHDEVLERHFEELHIRANTVEKVDQALRELTQTSFYNGDDKYEWWRRFQTLREMVWREENLPEEGRLSMEDAQKAYEENMIGELSIAVRNREMSYEAAQDVVDEAFRNGLVSGSFVESFGKKLDVANDPYFQIAEDHIADNLEGEDLARGLADLRNIFETMENMTPDKAIQLGINIANGINERKLQGLIREIVTGNAAVPRNLVATTRDIANGDWEGLAMLSKGREYLNEYGALMLDEAKRGFPLDKDAEFMSYWIDADGQWTGDENGNGGRSGAVILMDNLRRTYTFTVQNDRLVLWRKDDDGMWTMIRTEPTPGTGDGGTTGGRPAPREDQIDEAGGRAGVTLATTETGTTTVSTGITSLDGWMKAANGKWYNMLSRQFATEEQTQQLDDLKAAANE